MYCTLHMYVGMYLVYVLKQVGNYSTDQYGTSRDRHTEVSKVPRCGRLPHV